MVTNLFIKNIAVIDKLNIEFDKGLTVLTGETGAGKSIIIDSINLILGARAAKELIRYGQDSASVQLAVSEIGKEITDILEENGIDDDGGNLIISRQISTDGKNTCRINAQPVSTALLRQIAPFIIDIHGQHDNQILLNADDHISFLDSYAEVYLAPVMEKYTGLYGQYRHTIREIERLSGDEQSRLNRIDLLKYQTNEIEKAALVIGEDEELEQRKSVIVNIEKIAKNLIGAYEKLYNSDTEKTAYDNIGDAVAMLDNAKVYDDSLEAVHGKLYDLMYDLQAICEEIGNHSRNLSFEPAELDEIEQRLDVIKDIKRKYGGSIEKALDYYENACKELDVLSNAEENTEFLMQEKERLENALHSVASEITKVRRSYAQKLQSAITSQLHELDMPKAEFVVFVQSDDELKPNGENSVEFLFTANPGHPPKPMAKIASGGELSRIMLAVKTVFMGKYSAQLMVFDEIDAGVSGSAAAKLARKLAFISGQSQTVCITHLPQVAAMADNHYIIQKHVENGMTCTSLTKATGDERKHQLARMMSADGESLTALNYASELLENAKLEKNNMFKTEGN